MKKIISSAFIAMGILAVSLFAGCHTPDDNKTLSISNHETFKDVAFEGEKLTLKVTANSDWTISDIPDWVNVAPKTGSKSMDVTIMVDENDGDAREAELKIESEGITRKFTISQQAAPVVPTIKIDNNEFWGVPKDGATLDLKIVANTDWNITNIPSWATFSKTSGNGSDNLTITITANPNTNTKREATIKVSGGGSASANVFISQLASKMLMPDNDLRVSCEYWGYITVVDASTGEFTLTASGRAVTSIGSKCQTTLAGLEHFPNLKGIQLTGADAPEEVDVRAIRSLESLFLMSCEKVKVIRANNLPNLKYVTVVNHISRVALEELNIAGSISMDSVVCNGAKLKKLDLAGLSKLRYLEVLNNVIEEVTNLSDCVNLREFIIYSNRLTELNVSKNVNLTRLQCADNQIGELNLNRNTKLSYLSCGANNITELNIGHLSELVTFLCEGLKINELSFEDCNNIRQVYCERSWVKNLDFSGKKNLVALNCYAMPYLDTINLSGCNSISLLGMTHPAATSGTARNAIIKSTNNVTLDLSPYLGVTPSFKTFIMDDLTMAVEEGGGARSLAVTCVSNSKIESISLQNCTDLTSVTVTGNANLKYLNIKGSPVTTYVVNGNHPAIEELF